MPPSRLQIVLGIIGTLSPEQVHARFSSADTALPLLMGLTPAEQAQVMVAKNVKVFGGINPYVEDFLAKGVPKIAALPEGPAKEQTKAGQRKFIEVMLSYDDLSTENKEKLQAVLLGVVAAAAAAGGKRRWKMPRKMTRRYCKKTSCRKMGFTQKASCRPWKNCY